MMVLARKRPERLRQIVGIGAAADWTEDLFYQQLSPSLRRELEQTGHARLNRPHDTLELSWEVVLDGRNHLVFPSPLSIPCPLFLLHGTHDTVVPWEQSQRLLSHVTSPFSSLMLIQGGDHSLSRASDLELLSRMIVDPFKVSPLP
jgi:pimeloyl-ACP methyl ester carboxylesterase